MSRYLYGDTLHTYKGYAYCPEDDIEEDCVKTFHHVKIEVDGKWVHSKGVPMSPYSMLSDKQFERWIDMGQPTRKDMGGHQHKDHERYYLNKVNEELNRILLGVDE